MKLRDYDRLTPRERAALRQCPGCDRHDFADDEALAEHKATAHGVFRKRAVIQPPTFTAPDPDLTPQKGCQENSTGFTLVPLEEAMQFLEEAMQFKIGWSG